MQRSVSLFSSRFVTLIATLFIITSCGGGGGGSDRAPTSAAVNDTVTLDEDTSVTVNVTANDTNVTPSTAVITSEPGKGTASITDGTITYTPDADFTGVDSISYRVSSNNNSGNNSASLSLTVVNVNDAPQASDDAVATGVNSSFDINVLGNDTDIDNDTSTLSIDIVDSTSNGSIAVSPGGLIAYAPTLDFTGQDSFTYQITDPAGSISNIAAVSITVFAPGETFFLANDIVIPTTGYTAEDNVDVGQLIQVSGPITFNIDTTAVSFIVSFTGPSVVDFDSLFIVDVRNPQGNLLNQQEAIFCDVGLCTIQVPKKPGIDTTPGTWTLRLGTLESSTRFVDFAPYRLQIVSRIGPVPSSASTTRLHLKPFLTGSLPLLDINGILDEFALMAIRNNMSISIDPVTVVADNRFAEVSSDFRDSDTTDLLLMGEAGKINIYFLEGFIDAGGGGTLLGIAGGIPGTIGLVTEYNGALINGNATRGSNQAFYERTTAEFAFHEMMHLLGIFHTTEIDFGPDILADTPECLPADDSNLNGQPDVDECPDGLNPMFWENDLSREKTNLTADQQSVVRSSPISE